MLAHLQLGGWHHRTRQQRQRLCNQDHRLIGQLFDGTASCSNNIDDYFGRFNVSYPLLDGWLGACGPTLDGYDPNGVLVALDAAVQSIGNVDASYCNEPSIDPTVTNKNQGTRTLTSLTLLYHIDALPNSTYSWSGSLATGATEAVNLGVIAVAPGDPECLPMTKLDRLSPTDSGVMIS